MDFFKQRVKDIPFVDEVVTLKEGNTLREALKIFQDHNFGSLVVVDDEKKVVGIFTERDYLLKIAGQEQDLIDFPLSTFMTKNPKCINENDCAFKALMMMRLGKFRHVVILNEENRLAGILSVKEILDYFYDEVVATTGSLVANYSQNCEKHQQE